MSLIKSFDYWSEKNDSIWFDVLRVLLGIMLIAKAYMIMISITRSNYQYSLQVPQDGILASFVIAGILLMAGFLIFIGLSTRLASLVSIPAILAAYIFVQDHRSVADILISIIAAVLLVFFIIKGSGKFSAYFYIANSRRAREAHGKNAPVAGSQLTASVDRIGNLMP